MRYAPFLQDGGRIGFVAPSFGCNIEPYYSSFKNAQEVLEEMGYVTKCGPNAYEGCGIGISNTPEKCAEEFNIWYSSPDTDILISCGGGELMCEILPSIDFEKLKACPPKWFMGYSDNTNLTFLLATLCDTASIYGPNAAAFGMEPWHLSLKDALALLRGESRSVHSYGLWEKESLKTEESPLEPYNVTEPLKLVCRPETAAGEVTMQGRLLGGCLDILINLCGTGFDQVEAFNDRYEEDGVIWFLEACDLNPLSIRRGLWELSHAGWFRCARGFLIGRPYCHGEVVLGLDQYRAVTDMLDGFGLPVIMDADIGHLPPMMPLVCGSMAKVTAGGNKLCVEMEYR